MVPCCGDLVACVCVLVGQTKETTTATIRVKAQTQNHCSQKHTSAAAPQAKMAASQMTAQWASLYFEHCCRCLGADSGVGVAATEGGVSCDSARCVQAMRCDMHKLVVMWWLGMFWLFG